MTGKKGGIKTTGCTFPKQIIARSCVLGPDLVETYLELFASGASDEGVQSQFLHARPLQHLLSH